MIMYSLLAFISKIMGRNSDVMIECSTKTLRFNTIALLSFIKIMILKVWGGIPSASGQIPPTSVDTG